MPKKLHKNMQWRGGSIPLRRGFPQRWGLTAGLDPVILETTSLLLGEAVGAATGPTGSASNPHAPQATQRCMKIVKTMAVGGLDVLNAQSAAEGRGLTRAKKCAEIKTGAGGVAASGPREEHTTEAASRAAKNHA